MHALNANAMTLVYALLLASVVGDPGNANTRHAVQAVIPRCRYPTTLASRYSSSSSFSLCSQQQRSVQGPLYQLLITGRLTSRNMTRRAVVSYACAQCTPIALGGGGLGSGVGGSKMEGGSLGRLDMRRVYHIRVFGTTGVAS